MSETFFIEQDIEKLKRKSSKDIMGLAKRQKAYKDKVVTRPYLLESFKNTSDFTPTNGTLAQDTTNFKTGTSALKFTQTVADTYTVFSRMVSWNLLDATDFELLIYVEDPTLVSTVKLYLFNAGGGEFHQQRNTIVKGWNTLRFPKKDTTWASSGTIAWTDIITNFTINIGGTSTKLPVIIFDSFKKDVVEPLKVIFTADDGYASAYSEFIPYLESKGMKGNLAIYKSVVDTAGRMTTAQIQEVYAKGHDVLNHSSTHTDFSVKTYTQATIEVQDMREWLYNKGILRGLDMFVYPVNYTDMANQVIKDMGFVLARDSVGTYANYNRADNMLRLKSSGYNATAIFTDFTSIFNHALVTGGTFCIYMHDIMDTAVSVHIAKALFRQIVDYTKTYVDLGQCEVTTFTEWYDSLFK